MSEKRIKWVGKLVILLLLGGALWWSFSNDLNLPDLLKEEEEEVELTQMTEENFAAMIASADSLTVVNMQLDGNPDSEKIAAILEQLKQEQTYADDVKYANLDVVEEPELAEEYGAEELDLETFQGQLNFYAGSKQLGTLEGVTDRVQIEKAIEHYLKGIMKRVGKDWLPEVEGMQRIGGS